MLNIGCLIHLPMNDLDLSISDVYCEMGNLNIYCPFRVLIAHLIPRPYSDTLFTRAPRHTRTCALHECGLAPENLMFICFMTGAEDRIDPGQTLGSAASFPSIPCRATESSLNTTCTA